MWWSWAKNRLNPIQAIRFDSALGGMRLCQKQSIARWLDSSIRQTGREHFASNTSLTLRINESAEKGLGR